MPSVATISSATSPSRGTTATNAATSVFAGVGGPAGGVFAALIDAVGNDVAGLFGLASATTPTASASTDTGSPTSDTTTRKTRSGDGDATSDPTAALAALLGTVQMPAIAPTLGSAASLGAAADGRSHASDPTSGIGAPTADAAPAATPSEATTATTQGIGVGSSAAALAATLVAETAAKPAVGSALDAESSASTTAAPSTADTASAAPATAGTPTSPLPPAIAAAVAAARPGAETPEALRRLTGRAVPASDPTTTGSTTASSATPGSATAPSATTASSTTLAASTATASAATISEAITATDGSATPIAATSVTTEGDVAETGSATARPVRALSEKDRDATATTTLGPQTDRTAVVARDPEAPTPPAEVETAVAPSGEAASKPADRDRTTADATATLPDRAADPSSTALFTDLGQTRASTVAATREAGTSTTAAVALADLPRTIATRAQDGHSRFDIRLSPAELGSVDVRVEVRSSGEVRAHLVVERTETLDLMLRDQRQLERSLSDAGLDVGSSGLQFSLKEQPGGQPGQGWRTYGEAATRTERTTSDDDTTADAAVAAIGTAVRRPARVGGIDLSV